MKIKEFMDMFFCIFLCHDGSDFCICEKTVLEICFKYKLKDISRSKITSRFSAVVLQTGTMPSRVVRSLEKALSGVLDQLLNIQINTLVYYSYIMR